MIWQISLLISIVFAVTRESVAKYAVNNISPLTKVLLFYPAALLSIVSISIFYYDEQPFYLSNETQTAFVVGIFWGIGALALMHATKINMSKTQLTTSFKDPLSILLAVIFLGEASLLTDSISNTITLVAGFLLYALIIFLSIKKRNGPDGNGEIDSKKWLMWVTINVIIFSTSIVIIKHLVSNTNPATVLSNQYLGSTLSIFILSFIQRKKLTLNKPKAMMLANLNGIFTALSLLFWYMTLESAPLSVATPIRSILILLVTVPVGLFVFKEKQKFSKEDYLILIVGICAVILFLI